MTQNPLSRIRRQPVQQAGQLLQNLRLQDHLYGRVNTQGPFAVTAKQCSKCAENEPSLVTAVQRSFKTFASGRPELTMGSIARTIPSRSRGFSFRLST